MSAVVSELRGAGVAYGSRWALRGVDLSLAAGERVGVIGPSGAGKTTLLGLLNGSISPTEGSVRLLGSDLAHLGPGPRRRLQGRVGTVYQQLDLVGPLRVVHNVNAGRLGRWGLGRALASLVRPAEVASCMAALDRVGIGDRVFDRTDQLSGGQQQRVALARVLVQDPDLVLADEPVSALDPARADEVMGLLDGLVSEARPQRRALVVSLHRVDLALAHVDRVVALRGGEVVFDRPVAQVDPGEVDALFAFEGLAP